ncbi:MAG: hypothetical protein E7588_00145 [Ruminococcaceae bacterium]|nr:hypothetical protein [Oscillospiraceae bacterium]
MKKILMFLALILVLVTAAFAAKPIVFTFNTQEDIKTNITNKGSLTVALEDGVTKLTNKSNDPYFFLPVINLDIDTSVYKYIKVRFKTAGVDGRITAQIFTQTDSSGELGAPGSYTELNCAVNADEFTEATLDLSKLSLYSGTLKQLRYDPTVSRETTDIYLDYIALFDNEYAMMMYPVEVTEQDIIEHEKQLEEAKNKILRTEKPENIIYSFRSLTDFRNYLTNSYQVKTDFDSGYLRLINSGNDPHITRTLPEEEYFYADDLSVLKIRFKTEENLGTNQSAQIFFSTKNAQMGDNGTYHQVDFVADGQWQDLIIDMKKDISSSAWNGIITGIRYDPHINSEKIAIILDYVALFPNVEAAKAYSAGSILPPEGHDTVTVNYGTQKIILPAGTVKAGEEIEQYSISNTTAENPDKIIGGPVVKYTDAQGNENVVALSHSNAGRTIYVANRAGTYGLKYNSKKYDDIAGHWGYATIMYASNRNLFGGTSPTEFSPDIAMTRGMFITVLGRMQNVDTALYQGETGFGDVNVSEYYAPYIKWACTSGIASGISKSLFFPDEPITRSDMALYISKYISIYGYTFKEAPAQEFTDIASLDEAVKSAISSVQSVGIINGKGNGIFDPYGSSTRAEVATVMARLIKSILGLELDFFETSESSMEFKPLSKDRLILGAYIPHPEDLNLFDESQVRAMHEAGINFAILQPPHLSNISKQNGFEWYERYGIEFVYSDWNAMTAERIFDPSKANYIEAYADIIPYAGLSMVDEPGYNLFPAIGQGVKEFNALYPDKIAYVNLLPLYSSNAQLAEGAGAAAIEYYESQKDVYSKYLSEYIANVPTNYICADIYPCYTAKKTYKEYVKAIEAVARACRESGRDFWVVNQCCYWGSNHRATDVEDIYWQGYTVMSFGAKAIMYYVYASYKGHYETPIDANGEKAPAYYALQQFHNEIKRFEDVYLNYSNIGAFNHNYSAETCPWLEIDQPCKFDTITEIKCDKPLLIGCFESKTDASTAFTLVNHNDLSAPASAEIGFKVASGTVTAYINGYPTILVPDENGYFNVTLENGKGVFVTVK